MELIYNQWRETGKVIAAKMTVYAGEPEEYFSALSLRQHTTSWLLWMKYREECGEEITGDSWVMRNLWDVTTLPHDNNRDDDGMKSGVGKGVVFFFFFYFELM